MIANSSGATILAATLCALTLQSLSAAGESGAFTLITYCTEKGGAASGGASVEIYVPVDVGNGTRDALSKGLKRKRQGFYALDLTSFGKGKSLEPVLLEFSKTADGLLVDQYMRMWPVRFVPWGGGTVSFDERFASDLVCSPLGQTSR